MSLTITAANVNEPVDTFNPAVNSPLVDMSNDLPFYCTLQIISFSSPQGLPPNRNAILGITYTLKDNTGAVSHRSSISPKEMAQNPSQVQVGSITLKKSDDATSQLISGEDGLTYEVGTTLFGGAGGEMIVDIHGTVGAGAAALNLVVFGDNQYELRFDEGQGAYQIIVPFVIT